MDYRLEKYEKYRDHRGDLVVFLRQSELTTEHKMFGQIYFVTFKKKGAVRGNHYHKTWREWFGIVSGKIDVFLMDVRTKEQVHFVLDAKKDKYVRLEIGPYMVHTFRSKTKHAALLNYAIGEWTKKDDFHYELINPRGK